MVEHDRFQRAYHQGHLQPRNVLNRVHDDVHDSERP